MKKAGLSNTQHARGSNAAPKLSKNKIYKIIMTFLIISLIFLVE
jgi:hypothetical protein